MSARPSVGQIGVHNGLVTADQLDECLAIQSVMARKGFEMPIGQILVEKYYIEEAALRAILRAQQEVEAEERDRTRRWVDRHVGKLSEAENDLLVEQIGASQLIDLDQLDQAIEIQQALAELGIRKGLAEILVERGDLDRAMIQRILSDTRDDDTRPIQRRRSLSLAEEAATRRGEGAERLDPTRPDERERLLIGSLLVEAGLVEAERVKEILYCQWKLKELGVVKRVGELLVERGWLGLPDVRRILDVQRSRFGSVNWIDLVAPDEALAPAGDDRRLGQRLVDEGLLGSDQVAECLYILAVFQKMGFGGKSLADVVIDRGYLDLADFGDLLF